MNHRFWEAANRRTKQGTKEINVPDLVNGLDLSIPDEIAPRVGPAGIAITYQRLGSSEAPPVLLIMGVAAQSIHWPDAFCHALVDHGLQVIRFDNRDSGLSTHLSDAPTPNLPAAPGLRSRLAELIADFVWKVERSNVS